MLPDKLLPSEALALEAIRSGYAEDHPGQALTDVELSIGLLSMAAGAYVQAMPAAHGDEAAWDAAVHGLHRAAVIHTFALLDRLPASLTVTVARAALQRLLDT